MKRIDNPERDEGDRRRSSVDGHTDWEWVLGQERVWNYQKDNTTQISLIHGSVRLLDRTGSKGVIVRSEDSQIPLYVANHSTQHPYHIAAPSAINGAPSRASLAPYFCSNSLKSANIDIAGMACRARSVDSLRRKGSGVKSDEEGSPSEGTVWRMRPGAKR